MLLIKQMQLLKTEFPSDFLIKKHLDDSCILDSGCSYFYQNKNQFTTYKTTKGRFVTTGNHTLCMILGEGTVKFKMFDEWVITYQVFKMLHTLVYMATLCAKGCRYSNGDGVPKVCNGS